MKNLILIGMPACGKSTVGVVLAKTVGMRFMDTDLLIQEREGALLQDLIDKKGNDYFQKVEEYVLRSIDTENTVISTGGSAVYYPEAIRHFKKKGLVVYLKVPFEAIEERLDNITTRGITMGPGQTLKDIYNLRIPLYEANADITVDTGDLTVEQTIEKIMKAIG
ncbi:shikimate kinase [Aminipila butyrica]|uniref:Shikimate kinase n=1 Tax=Aminipila butyrica TaxID=433296 RepID=A0A858BTM5_9FIRM|nr:shikimate kinase [Aminipila butyrica]QIB69283.1 shikimate kinase [Aminipila butyrica]